MCDFTNVERLFIKGLKQNDNGEWYLKFQFANVQHKPQSITNNLLNYLKEKNINVIHIAELNVNIKSIEKFNHFGVFKGIHFIIDNFTARGNDGTAIKLDVDEANETVKIIETIRGHYEYNEGDDKTIVDVKQYSLDIDDKCLTSIGNNSLALFIYYNNFKPSENDTIYQAHKYLAKKVEFDSKLYSGNSVLFNNCIINGNKFVKAN
jgi:hypothetical protein